MNELAQRAPLLKISIQDTMNLFACTDIKTDTKRQEKWGEHPSGIEHVPLRNAQPTVDRPTAEHPTHSGSAPPQNTLLNVDLPMHKRPYLRWNCPTSKTPLTVDLTHNRTSYSPWTSPTGDHPTQCLPAPPWNTLLILDPMWNTY